MEQGEKNEKDGRPPNAEEASTVDEGRSARYRREHGEFLAQSLRPLPPLSPIPAKPNGWLARTLWLLVCVYVVFMSMRWLFRWLAR